MLGTLIAVLIPTIIGLAVDRANARDEAERQEYNNKIQRLIDLAGNQKDQLVSELANKSEDTARLVSELGYATRGGSTFKYRNKKQRQYVQERKANLERQQELAKQQIALNQLMK